MQSHEIISLKQCYVIIFIKIVSFGIEPDLHSYKAKLERWSLSLAREPGSPWTGRFSMAT